MAAESMRDVANRRDVIPFAAGMGDPRPRREEDEVFVETGEAPPEEASRPGAVSFATLIPPDARDFEEAPDTTQLEAGPPPFAGRGSTTPPPRLDRP